MEAHETGKNVPMLAGREKVPVVITPGGSMKRDKRKQTTPVVSLNKIK